MKKMYIISIMAILLIGGQVFADVVTTKRKINSQSGAVNSESVKRSTSERLTPSNKINVQDGSKLSRSVKNCKKYSESLDSNISGVNFNFKINILGWVDNKCRIDFEANSTGISDMFQTLYGVDPSMATIQTFEPKISCEFTKQQLMLVGDSILQEEARASGKGSGKMLKDPSTIDIT